MTDRKHIVILGAGPGGYVAAIRAAQLGAQVTVIERDALGGVCLNAGCIPSKALLNVVDLGDKVKRGAELGLQVGGEVSYDLPRMIARKNQVVSNLTKGIGALFKAWGIAQIPGSGVLTDVHSVRVTDPAGKESRVTGDAVILATGSSWPDLPQFPVDGRRILTSKEALDLAEIPRSLLIIGAGVEGCEFASLYGALGTQVQMVEVMPRILPLEDEEIAGLMLRELTKRNVTVHCGTTVDRVDLQADPIQATFKDGQAIAVEKILVSVGRGFNTKGIGLEAAGVQVGRRGEILVNEQMETNVPGVYAIGDVVGKAMLAHVASAQGKVAVANVLGHPRPMNYHVVPAGIFTLPEIGRVGLTEEQAREHVAANGGGESALKVGRFRYMNLGKAQAVGETAGLFKIITDARTGAILGAHIIGAHAADLIHEVALGMQLGASASKLAEMIHAHPTLTEGILEAAEDVDGLAIHLARKR
jgi:dihydrolipoamide dehydrogenase